MMPGRPEGVENLVGRGWRTTSRLRARFTSFLVTSRGGKGRIWSLWVSPAGAKRLYQPSPSTPWELAGSAVRVGERMVRLQSSLARARD